MNCNALYIKYYRGRSPSSSSSSTLMSFSSIGRETEALARNKAVVGGFHQTGPEKWRYHPQMSISMPYWGPKPPRISMWTTPKTTCLCLNLSQWINLSLEEGNLQQSYRSGFKWQLGSQIFSCGWPFQILMTFVSEPNAESPW